MLDLPPSVSASDYAALAEFRYTIRRFLHFSEEAAAAEGLSPQHHQALLAIKGFCGPEAFTIRDLAERLQIRHHSAVGLVNRLAADALVAREPDPQDGRKVQLHLTPQGAAALEKLSAVHQQELRRLGPTLRTLLQHLAPE